MTRFDTTLKARPTTYKGVEMRSRLEARFAAGCDKLGIAWEYEPRAFASEKGQYLPDFSRDMYGTTRQDVLDLMGAHGYRYEHLAAEHEHHVLFWHPEKHEPVLPYGGK